MWWTNPLCNSAEDLGTLAENEPPTGYEPNTEACVDYTRNPPTSSGPPMTSTTMTIPSAWRSLHHCSPKSEKTMRAVDEPITLKKKACRLVCRRQSVMTERGDPLFARLTHKFRVFKNFKDTAQKVIRFGFFWSDKESRFSLIVKQRFKNTSSRPIMTEEVFKS